MQTESGKTYWKSSFHKPFQYNYHQPPSPLPGFSTGAIEFTIKLSRSGNRYFHVLNWFSRFMH